MSELQDFLQKLRPLWTPFGAITGLLLASGIAFSQAGQVNLPPAPETLLLERVRIDEVRHTREPAGPHGPSQTTSVAVRLAQSQDWPGISFRFSGGSSGVSIIPPVIVDLYLTSSIEEQAKRHRQWPTLFPQLQVYGVIAEGELLVDPRLAYTAGASQKRQNELLGYGFLALASIPGLIFLRRARAVWSRLLS